METNINSQTIAKNTMIWPFKEKVEQKKYAVIMVFFGIISILLSSLFTNETSFYISGIVLSCLGLMYMFEALL